VSALVVSGTGTGVGKTVVTAAIAALAQAAGSSVAVVKPAQSGTGPGEPGDLTVVQRLTGILDLHEMVRYDEPLAPASAARVSGRRPVDLRTARTLIHDLANSHDLVLVEGAGGLLVRYDEAGTTIADLAGWLEVPVVVVTRSDLGTLNHTALTLEALAHRTLDVAGVVVGAWPREPDLACRTNLEDLEEVAGQPLAGVLPDGAAALAPDTFLDVARAGLGPPFGGMFDPAAFRSAQAADVVSFPTTASPPSAGLTLAPEDHP
jgi:dethiobiotin synthetase